MGNPLPSLKIDSGLIRLAINDDPGRVIAFNPKDVIFAEKFYNLIKKFEIRQAEFEAKAKELDAKDEVDSFGILVNTGERLAFLKDICQFVRDEIDGVFGEGTSQTVFGDAIGLDMFGQFFDLYRFPHVKNKNFSSLTHKTCLQYQLAGLRDGHEIAGNIRMCDQHGPT